MFRNSNARAAAQSMKRCFKYLLLFLVCLHLSNLDSVFADVEAPLDQSADDLTSDGPVIITNPMGTDLELLSGTGFINLTLLTGTLEFKVCKDQCMRTSQVCYDSTQGFHVPKAVGSCHHRQAKQTYCGLKIKGDKEDLTYARYPFPKKFIRDCLSSSMTFPNATVLPGESPFESCDPKIDSDNDNMIQLWVDIDQLCPVIVKNAALYVPPSTSTSFPSSSITVPSSKKEESSDASLPWWAIMIIAIVVFFALVAVIIVVICIYKKRQRSKQMTPPTAPTDPKPVPTVPAATNVTTIVETSSKRRGNLNFTKFQPSLERPKKDKKKKRETTEEQPSTTEDAPPPPMPQPSTTNPLQPPVVTPVMNPADAYHRRTVPKGLKSVKTDSLDKTTKKDKMEMVEEMPVSTDRYCLKSADSDVLQEMKANYPEGEHQVLNAEVDLLCGYVSEMYQEINNLATSAEQKLTSVGCKFDVDHRLLSVTAAGRRLLHDKQTASSIVYFAFGAEYHQFVTEDSPMLNGSVPLLMVIALQPRFSELFRRKACARMRRQLCKILGFFTAEHRAKLPFPVNIVERAYCKNPKIFCRPSELKTDSEGDKKKEAQKKQGLENVEAKRGEKMKKKQPKKQ